MLLLELDEDPVVLPHAATRTPSPATSAMAAVWRRLGIFRMVRKADPSPRSLEAGVGLSLTPGVALIDRSSYLPPLSPGTTHRTGWSHQELGIQFADRAGSGRTSPGPIGSPIRGRREPPDCRPEPVAGPCIASPNPKSPNCGGTTILWPVTGGTLSGRPASRRSSSPTAACRLPRLGHRDGRAPTGCSAGPATSAARTPRVWSGVPRWAARSAKSRCR